MKKYYKLTFLLSLFLFSVSTAYYTDTFKVPGFASNTLYHAANVIGISASVAPNEYNTLAQKLQERADELNKREQALGKENGGVAVTLEEINITDQKIIAFFVFAIGILLLALILFNFYLDWRRRAVY